MKVKIIFLLLFITLSPWVKAQDECSMYYPLKQGVKFQVTTYDKKNKPETVSDYEVMEVKNTSKGIVATIHGSFKDKKDRASGATDFDVICKDGKISIDFKSLMSPQLMDQLGEMEYDISGTNLDWPNDFKEGESLPDANLTMKIGMGGMNMNMSVDIKNRKAHGRETITTPAGTFDCIIVTYDTEVNMGVRQKMSSKEWIAKGIGMVKQETSQNGKLQGTALLTEFSK